MRVFENQTFDSLDDRDSGAVFSDMEFRKCYFESCGLSITLQPSRRSTVRNVQLLDCSQRGCSIYGALFENVLIDGLKTNGQLLQVWGAAFNHVVLRGKIDRLMISSIAFPGVATPEQQQAFDDANTDFCRRVDWALDISHGEFKELDIRGLPTHLIRRDVETQVVVTRKKALQGQWKELELSETLWRTWINDFLQTEEPSTVLAAPKRDAKFRNYLADLRLLREAGVAEPD